MSEIRQATTRLVVDAIMLVVLKAALNVSQTLPGTEFVLFGQVSIGFAVRVVVVVAMLSLLVRMYGGAVTVASYYIQIGLNPGGPPSAQSGPAARSLVNAVYIVVIYALLRDIVAVLFGYVPAIGWLNGLFAAIMLVVELVLLLRVRDQLHRAVAPSPPPQTGLACPRCGAGLAPSAAACAACGQPIQAPPTR